jgi:hypothetical protein
MIYFLKYSLRTKLFFSAAQTDNKTERIADILGKDFTKTLENIKYDIFFKALRNTLMSHAHPEIKITYPLPLGEETTKQNTGGYRCSIPLKDNSLSFMLESRTIMYL